jgi:hypothetical protein
VSALPPLATTTIASTGAKNQESTMAEKERRKKENGDFSLVSPAHKSLFLSNLYFFFVVVAATTDRTCHLAASWHPSTHEHLFAF